MSEREQLATVHPEHQAKDSTNKSKSRAGIPHQDTQVSPLKPHRLKERDLDVDSLDLRAKNPNPHTTNPNQVYSNPSNPTLAQTESTSHLTRGHHINLDILETQASERETLFSPS